MGSKLEHRLNLWQESREYLVDRIVILETLLINAENSLTALSLAKDKHIDDLTAELESSKELDRDLHEQIKDLETTDVLEWQLIIASGLKTINELRATLAEVRAINNRLYNVKDSVNNASQGA